MRIFVLVILSVAIAISVSHVSPKSAVDSAMMHRSRLSDGNLANIQFVMDKARRGEPITIGFMGGSITYGERATRPDRAFSDLVTKWWCQHFPASQITMVNAGLPGTGSTYACLRASRDLLSHHPDVVIVEFGVNDRNDLEHAQTYEGLVRQLLEDHNHPAVMLLFMLHRDGTNAQEFESQIGQHYQLPMISFRDAVWPKIAAGQMRLSDVIADSVHPSDEGHLLISRFIQDLLNDCFKKTPIGVQLSTELPSPLFTDLFTHTRLIRADDIRPVHLEGWSFDAVHHCWASDQPGSVIEFDLSGSQLAMLYSRTTPDAGRVAVTVDDNARIFCDGWFDGTWAGYCQAERLEKLTFAGVHRVRIELSKEKNALSNGFAFQILGFGSAG